MYILHLRGTCGIRINKVDNANTNSYNHQQCMFVDKQKT